MSTSKRIVFVVLLIAVFSIAIALPAQALTIEGGDRAHRQAVIGTLNYQPKLLAAIEKVFGNMNVRINYGGMAYAYPDVNIDVSIARVGKAFTDMVVHETMHKLQLALDAPGGYKDICHIWLAKLDSMGIHVDIPTAWHYLAENLAGAFYGPFYATNDCELKLTKAEMVDLLKSLGVEL